ncbi:MAG: hypothetical protein SCJ94_11280 [Bacillota bacterium]|nr:hypothetical protein [Bacillota bacterium]
MRKILLGLVITGFALILFITFKPQRADLVVMPESPTVDVSKEPIILETAPYFTTVQGASELALTVTNNTSAVISFSLGHEHAHLTFQPQGDRIAPGITREVMVLVDPQCPVGEISLPVYLRSELDGERVGMEALIELAVIPGELTLESDGIRLSVFWNDEPAPRGVNVYYRSPGTGEWRTWGETPRIDPPANLPPGTYELEFMAELGRVVSSVETLEIVVEEPPAKKEPEPEPVDKSVSTEPEEEKEVPPPPPEPPKPGTKEYLIMIMQQMNPPKEEEEEEEEPGWWEMN